MTPLDHPNPQAHDGIPKQRTSRHMLPESLNLNDPQPTAALIDLLAMNLHALGHRDSGPPPAGLSIPIAADDVNTPIPFHDLPESEKQRLRSAATMALQAMRTSGFRIENAATPPTPSGTAIGELLRRLRSPAVISVVELRWIWHARKPGEWSESPDLYALLGQRILEMGEPLLAYDILSEGTSLCPGELRLKQLLALALARSGAPHRANRIVNELFTLGHTDGETLGILARTHKDLWALSIEPKERQHQLQTAHEVYLKAYRLASDQGRLDEGSYNGINAATTAVLLNRHDLARQLAREVLTLCEKSIRQCKDLRDPYWINATRAEAALILGDWTRAEDSFLQAAQLGRGRWADLSTTRKQARILLDHLNGDRDRFESCFHIPCVVAFSGHMIDRPDRASPRFPASKESLVREEVNARLRTLNAGFGYASAACGSDILFLEAMLDRGAEINVILPFEKEDFIRTSVNTGLGNEWEARFNRVLDRAAEITILGEETGAHHDAMYQYANLVLDGTARLRACHLDTEMIPMAVWDGRVGDGSGGTSSVVDYWLSQDQRVEVIQLNGVEAAPGPASDATSVPTPSPPSGSARSLISSHPKRIMAVFFADIVGYSKLKDRVIPLFIRHLFGAIAELLRNSTHVPVAKNTWGDAFFFIFANIEDAGKFALLVRDLVNTTNWAEKGLPANLNLRIALHAGPVYSITDPVLQQQNYFGSHVSRTARIEPITPPGKVYASQAFAALSIAQGITDFKCDYVGHVPLAKEFGSFPLYHLRRVGEAG